MAEPASAGRSDTAIADRLADPLATVSFDGLTRHWRCLALAVSAARPPDFDDGPDLAGRIRGAWGHALRDLAAAQQEDAASRASAHAVLFGPHGRAAAGLELPKPYVLNAAVAHGRLDIRLTLFGFALHWAVEAMEALALALRRGIALAPGSRIRVPIDPDAWSVRRIETLPVPAAAGPLLLDFDTPLIVRRGAAMTLDGGSLFMAMANRVNGLARWQDLRVEDDFRALKAHAGELAVSFDGQRPRRWVRHSSRQPGRAIPMAGLVGPVIVGGDIGPFLPLIALAETCHVGSHTSLGLGHFALAGGWSAATATSAAVPPTRQRSK